MFDEVDEAAKEHLNTQYISLEKKVEKNEEPEPELVPSSVS
jgi:hypothetical protein